MKNSVNIKKIFTLTIAPLLGIRTFLIVGSSTVLAQSKFNEADFRVKDSGQGRKTLIKC